MLISTFLSCALLLIQSATCSDLQQDTPSVNEKSSKQLETDLNTDTYGYHHPPLPEINEQKRSRKEKSLNIDEQTTTQRTYSRGFKPRARPKTSTPRSEIPVQVIYETTPTTVPSTSHSTTSPLDKTTKVYVPRRQFHSNTIKKIDIIETTAAPNNIASENDKEDVPTFMKKDENYVSTTEVPRRLRGRFLNTKKKLEITEKTEATSNIPVENITEKVPKIVEKDSNDVTTRKFQRRSRGRLSNANKIIEITEKPVETSKNPTENVTDNVPTITEKDSNDVTTKKFQMKSRGRLSNTNKNMEITEKPAEMSNIATKNITEDVPIITKKDYSKVSTTKFPTRSRGRHLNFNKKVEIGETTETTNNIVTKNVTEDMSTFTEKDETVISTTAGSKRFSGRKLNTNNKIDLRETTAATINIASENVTEDMITLKEKDKGFLLTTEFPKKLRGSYYNTNKKIVIRQTSAATSEVPTENSTGDVSALTKKGKSYVSTTEFPKRSRGSYFKKRTGIPTPKVKILEEKNFVYSHSGNFHYSYLGGDGTKISSEGSLKSYDNNKTGEAVTGSVFYKDKDGNDYSLSYTADENGYRPVGAHLPTPPPLPPAIARALKYIADKNKSTPSPLAKSE